jgi:phosphate transport system substrate-binding protein
MSPKKLMTHWAGGRCCVDLRTGEYRVNQLRAITVAGLLAATVLPAVAVEISGAGATFPYPLYAKWADTYRKETGIGLNYQSIGSGGGIKQIEAKTVTFGATDAPLKGEELDKFGLVQFPMVMGGIVPVVNIEGVKPGELVLDGPAVAAIFLGKVKSWNDPAIKKLNPNAKLPSQAIAVVHRSDGSGTTFNFTYYLALVSPDWKSQVGSNTSVEWPIGIGAKGNEGVSNNVSQAKGSIGYVEYAYARQNKMTYTKMVNKDGKTVAPTAEAFQAAAANADWNSAPGFGLILANQPGTESWPMTAATFILMPKQPPTPWLRLRPSSSLLGPTPRATRWPKSLITCRCRKKSSRISRRSGQGRSRTSAASRSTSAARWRNRCRVCPPVL